MRSVRSCVLLLSALSGVEVSAAERPAWRAGLSARELAIQRWFSYLTLENDRRAEPWAEWHDDGKQLDVTGFRYQLAFCGYGCAALGSRTPAYRELVGRQLRDLCQRMVDVRVWSFVTHYWDYGNDPPDPCKFENVMYTGHLTQLMCLYELMTGDDRYSTDGWDFVWSGGRKVHYTLEKAIRRMHVQSRTSPSGGICCEPGMLFAVCNNHSANSFLLFDLLHGTNYGATNKKWFSKMSKAFVNRVPGTRAFLYIVYMQKKQMFLPVGDVGADGWALGWGHPWYPDKGFAEKGWKHTLKRAGWVTPAPDQMYAAANPLSEQCGGAPVGVANSFLPLVAVQVEGAQSENARKILSWLETGFGRSVDTDRDGHKESYYYHTNDAQRIPATGNIAAALATDGDSLRDLFRTDRRKILNAPTLAHVDIPNVAVRSAEYIAPVLRFAVCKARPGFKGTTQLVCEKIGGGATVTRDGKPYTRFRQRGPRLTIRTDLDREHVFEVTVGG